MAAAAPLPALPHAASEARPKHAPFHIPSLDGLRAVSFFIVFLSHAGLEKLPGGFGVTVFFFLSGYLITTLMRMEADKTGQVSLRLFYLRRVLRILPPFYVVLIAATGLTALGVVPGVLRAMPVIAQACHFSNYWIAYHGWEGAAGGTGVYWSLAVEEHFYFAFPAIFLLLRRSGITGQRKAIVFWGLCALVLAWRCTLVMLLGANTDRTYLCSDTRVDSILWGCALAVYNNPILDDRKLTAPPSILWRNVWLPLGLLLLFATFVVRGPVFRETFRYTLQGIGLYPLFVCAIRYPDFFLFRPLNWRPVRFLGTLSYSLYLVHHAVLFAITQPTSLLAIHAHPVVQGLAAITVAIGLAWTIYHFVEKPCARLRRRLSSSE